MKVDILVIGASLAGWTCAETLRQDGFTGSILVAGEEPHPPYDRPPLSKGVLAGTAAPDSVQLVAPQRADELNITLWLGMRAISCDTTTRTVRFEDGREVNYGELVIASGVRPRALAGAHTVRTLDDVAKLGEIEVPARIVIAGAGFLGTELAATLSSLRHQVTVVSPTADLLADQLGPDLARLVTGLHRRHGVEVLTAMVTSVIDAESGKLVRTSSGESVPAEVVIACIGAVPNTEWLHHSGLTLDNGVHCDDKGRAGEHEWAIGDVANRAGRRVEHRMSASTQAVRLAGQLLAAQAGGSPDRDHPMSSPIPYVWTDQYDTTIQLYGATAEVDRRELVAGSVETGKMVVLCGHRGKLVGVLGTGMIKATMAACKQIRAGADFDVEELRANLPV